MRKHKIVRDVILLALGACLYGFLGAAAAALESLGVTAFDAQGNMRLIQDTFSDLNTALSQLSQQEQTEVLRVSTALQAIDGYSVAMQRRTLIEWCRERSYEITGIYADEGISGKDILKLYLSYFLSETR